MTEFCWILVYSSSLSAANQGGCLISPQTTALFSGFKVVPQVPSREINIQSYILEHTYRTELSLIDNEPHIQTNSKSSLLEYILIWLQASEKNICRMKYSDFVGSHSHNHIRWWLITCCALWRSFLKKKIRFLTLDLNKCIKQIKKSLQPFPPISELPSQPSHPWPVFRSIFQIAL